MTLAAARQQPATLQRESPASSRARLGDVVVVPGRGLRFPQRLPFDRWLHVGRQLADVHSSSAWCLGDWLVYGEAAYDGRYREAIERTSLDYQTLRNYAWVAKRFVLSRRRDSLSFGHHAEVAALPEAEQNFWLRKADELRWSVKQLRHEVRASHSERSAGDGGQPSRGHGMSQDDRAGQDAPCSDVRLDVPVTPVQLELYRAAAARASSALEKWIVLALDQAAAADMPATGTGLRGDLRACGSAL